MIAIVDVNNCYASIEQAFDPSILGKPVVVLTNNDGQVIAKNQMAKALGIDFSIPYYKLKPELDEKGVVVRSSNYTLYGDISARIMRILKKFNPDMEIYSIDEAFLNFANFQKIDIELYCLEIRRYILQGLSIPVSIGIASTKTLAKIANRYIKNHDRVKGVFMLDNEDKRISLLKQTPINDIWGIGSRLTRKLNKLGITTAYELSKVDYAWARKNMTVTGERLIYELNGISCIPLEYMPKKKDMIGSQKSFGKYQQEYEPIEIALSTYTARCAEKLRRQKSVCGALQVHIQTNNWNQSEIQYFNSVITTLDIPTDNTGELIKIAAKGLKHIYKKGYTYKRVGITLLDLRDKSDGTLNLFTEVNRERSDKVMKILDKINQLNGSNALRFASMAYSDQWKMKQSNLSKCYTTRLSDIIKIK